MIKYPNQRQFIIASFLLLSFLCSIMLYNSQKWNSRRRNLNPAEEKYILKSFFNSNDTSLRRVVFDLGDTQSQSPKSLQTPRINFTKDFKSPCIYIRDQLQCFPFFFNIGPQKSGTSDLFFRLTLHPDIIAPTKKEPHFMSLRKIKSINKKILLPPILNSTQFLPAFKEYFSNFETLSAKLTNCDEKNCRRLISCDASASTIWENNRINEEMKKISRASNKSFEEFSYLVPNLILEYLPKSKFITLLRNPVERCGHVRQLSKFKNIHEMYSHQIYLKIYSDYKFFSAMNRKQPNVSNFDQLVKKRIEEYQNCTQNYSSRYCTYSLSFPMINKTASVTVGMYHVFLKDYIRIVPEEQMFIERLEDYSSHTEIILTKIFNFLELSKTDDKVMKKIVNHKKSNIGQNIGDMLPSTRKMLEEFYSPFNQKLATLLGDNRFLWEK